MTASNALHRSEFAQTDLIGIKQPNTSRTGHTEHSSFGAKYHNFTGVNIHSHGTRSVT